MRLSTRIDAWALGLFFLTLGLAGGWLWTQFYLSLDLGIGARLAAVAGFVLSVGFLHIGLHITDVLANRAHEAIQLVFGQMILGMALWIAGGATGGLGGPELLLFWLVTTHTVGSVANRLQIELSALPEVAPAMGATPAAITQVPTMARQSCRMVLGA